MIVPAIHLSLPNLKFLARFVRPHLPQKLKNSVLRIGYSDWVITRLYLRLRQKCRNSADYGADVGQITEALLPQRNGKGRNVRPERRGGLIQRTGQEMCTTAVWTRAGASGMVEVTGNRNDARAGWGTTIVCSGCGRRRAAARTRARQSKREKPSQLKRKIAIQRKCESTSYASSHGLGQKYGRMARNPPTGGSRGSP